METNPEKIWQLAKAGNQSAWQQLYQIFGGKVFQFFLRNTRNHELAMDKVQEVFLKIYRNRESFSYGSLKTWIFRIAKNTLIDEWRRSGNREILTDVIPDVVEADTRVEEEVIAGIEQRQMAVLIDQCLDQLEEQDRMIVCLVYLSGLSIPELAKVMETPLGTAKTRVRSARLKLDSMLNEKLELKKFEKSI